MTPSTTPYVMFDICGRPSRFCVTSTPFLRSPANSKASEISMTTTTPDRAPMFPRQPDTKRAASFSRPATRLPLTSTASSPESKPSATIASAEGCDAVQVGADCDHLDASLGCVAGDRQVLGRGIADLGHHPEDGDAAYAGRSTSASIAARIDVGLALYESLRMIAPERRTIDLHAHRCRVRRPTAPPRRPTRRHRRRRRMPAPPRR